MRLPFIGLRTKLFLFAFVVALPFLVFAINEYHRARAEVPTHYLQQAERRAERVGIYLEHTFGEAVEHGEILATESTISSMEPGPMITRLREVQARLRAVRNISVWDARGRNVASVEPPASDEVSVADLPHFQQAMATNQSVVSNAFRGRILSEHYIVAVATPVRNATGEPVGTIHLIVQLDEALARATASEDSPETRIVVVDRSGRVAFASGPNASELVGHDLSGYGPVQTALAGSTAANLEQAVPLLSGTFATVWMPTPEYGWVVGIVSPSETAVRPAEEMLRWRLLAVTVVFVLAGGLAVAFSSYLVQPIARLIDACRAIGRGDLSQRLHLRTHDEIEWLADSLNLMAEQLAARDAERAAFERAREEFISIVAHDLRSPITVISGHAQLLERLAGEEHWSVIGRRAIAAIRTSTSRLNGMVSDLLDASRIEARRLTLERKQLALYEFVRDTIEQLRPTLGEHPLAVRLSGCDPTVSADPRRLAQILSNLLTNAAKYSDPKAAIDVDVEYVGGWGRIQVVDHGRGIPSGDLPHIFRRFYRPAERVGQRTEGLGLGLYIVHGLVEAHGGRVSVESKVGVGSTFTVELPAPAGCVVPTPSRANRSP